jgi:hypothetical protein
MPADKTPQKDAGRRPEPKPEVVVETIYEMRNMSEILKDYLPWRRKKKRKQL